MYFLSFFNFSLIKMDVSFMTVLAFSRLNELHCSLSNGGIPLLSWLHRRHDLWVIDVEFVSLVKHNIYVVYKV
jgi:hypothetical protein